MFSPRARRVEDWVVDPEIFQVFRDGEAVALEPRAVRVLLYLMDNPRRLVTKEELFESVWSDTAVTDNALTRAVAQLRKAIGDDAKQPRYIETVPTQGYRFIGNAEPVPAAEAPPAASVAEPVRTPPVWLLAASGVGLVLLAGALLRGPASSRIVPPPSPPVQLTTSAGLDVSPTFSPDGAQLAYASDRSGSFEIYVRPVSGGREVQVTSDAGQNILPTWSPDGQRIAYYSAKSGGIRVIPALGGTSVMLTDFGCEPAWSPDGKWIAFRAGGFQSLAPTEAIAGLGSSIWVVSPDGGTPRAVTKPSTPPGIHGAPAWSPTSRRILFSAVEWTSQSLEQSATLWTVGPDGTGLERHLTRPNGLTRPRFTPDGKHVIALGGSVSALSRKDADFGVFRYDLDGVGEPQEIARTGVSPPRDLAISADGKRIAYSITTFTSSLMGLPMDAASYLPSGAPVPLVADTSYRNTMPSFSPDGRKIAFHARRRGSLADVMVFDRESGATTQVTTGPYADLSASWTPDGASIVYSTRREGRKEVRQFTFATGQEIVRMTDSMALLGGRLSGDGRYVLYQLAEGGRLGIYRQSLDGSKPVRLTPDSISAGFPSASRDSKWIAVEVAEGDGNSIAVMPFEGGPIETIVKDRGQNWSHSWSSDSSRITFTGLRDGAWNIWWVTRDGKQQKRLTDNRLLRIFMRYPEWSPAGDMIVFELGETKGNIFVSELPGAR